MNTYLFSIIFWICGIILVFNHRKKFRNLPITTWRPSAAWSRALIYFCICNLFSIYSGTFDVILSQQVVTSQQLSDPLWIISCIICFVYIFLAYWILWARLTLTFDRKYYLGSEIIFGFLWGWSSGQILLSFYHLWSQAHFPLWSVYLGSYACMGAWQYFVQDYFWDVYVSPEHDTPKSIKLKTIISHIPNVAICLLFLVIYNNYLIYVLTQIFALMAASIFQRFPSPFATGNFQAPRTEPGLFSLPHGAGYLSTDKNYKKMLGRSIDEFSEGMTFEYSRKFTQKDTELMGDLIGDHNLFHYDGEFIRNTRFKKPIVHGLLVGGMICHFGGDIFPGPGYLAEEMDFKFIKPVFFGETIRAVGKVVRVDKIRKRVTFHMTCYNQKNEIVLEGNVIGIPFQVKVKE